MTIRLTTSALYVVVAVCLAVLSTAAQEPPLLAKASVPTRSSFVETTKPILESTLPEYFDEDEGITLTQIIEAARNGNEEIKLARIEIDRARARLLQAGLRPNPTIDFEQTSGAILGNAGDRTTTLGASLPIEFNGRRDARLNIARLDIEVRETDLRNRERQLSAAILTAYADALGAIRELEITERILELDLQTTRFIQIRVNEGDTPPLELSLFQAEIDRLRSRRELIESRIQSHLTRLKLLAALPFDKPLKVRERIDAASFPNLPVSDEARLEVALRTRADVQLARLEEKAALAGLQLVRANGRPTLNAYARYSQGRSNIDLPNASFPQKDRAMTFGVTIGVPIFNKNQGATAEAELGVEVAKQRLSYAERIVEAEITAAGRRYEAASRAVTTLQSAALPRSLQNVEVFRRVYEIGEIRVTELIAEQRRLTDVNRDLTEALTEKYRALADLQTAIGIDLLQPEKK